MNKIVKSILKTWNNWFLKSPERTVSNRRYSAMTKELKDYLLRHFDFRYNRLTGVTEYRPAGEKRTAFRPIDDREMNGMIIDARLKGMLCRHSDLPTLVLSNNIESSPLYGRTSVMGRARPGHSPAKVGFGERHLAQGCTLLAARHDFAMDGATTQPCQHADTHPDQRQTGIGEKHFLPPPSSRRASGILHRQSEPCSGQQSGKEIGKKRAYQP